MRPTFLSLAGLEVLESAHLPEGVEALVVDALPAIDPSSAELRWDPATGRLELSAVVKLPRTVVVMRKAVS